MYSATHKASHLKDGDECLSSQNYFGVSSKNNIGHFFRGPKTYMIFLISEKKVNYTVKEFLFSPLRISISFKGAELSR